jgi:hypothetical protein
VAGFGFASGPFRQNLLKEVPDRREGRRWAAILFKEVLRIRVRVGINYQAAVIVDAKDELVAAFLANRTKGIAA